MTKRILVLLCIGAVGCLVFTPAAGAAGETLRLKRFSYVDRQGIGSEAFSLLIPVGWQFQGGVRWVLDNPALPAVAQFKVRNPKGREEMEVFPNQALFWTNNQMLLSTFPAGARYFGAEVRPVAGPQEALIHIVLPRFRGGVSGLKVVGKANLPQLAKALGAGAPQPGVKTFGQAAKIRIEYTQNGVPMEEEIFGVVEGFSFSVMSMQGPLTNTNWFVDYLFSFKAPKGTLDRQAKLFQTMAMSFKVNPQWFNKYNQLVNALIQAQIRQIHSIGELSRYISRTNNEISDAMRDSYNQRQKVYDGIAENFSESVRGSEHYYNPIEDQRVELPGGYAHVWTNPNGEYVLSDNPNFNPNVGSNLHWQELQKR